MAEERRLGDQTVQGGEGASGRMFPQEQWESPRHAGWQELSLYFTDTPRTLANGTLRPAPLTHCSVSASQCRCQPKASPLHGLQRPPIVLEGLSWRWFFFFFFGQQGVKVTDTPETVLLLGGNPGYVLTQACPSSCLIPTASSLNEPPSL